MLDIAANLKQVHEKIATAAKAAARDAKDIKLIAVAKGKTEENIRAAIRAGQRVFGENRVQEAKTKYEVLRRVQPDLELHLIGPLQTNKVDDAVKVFDVIETLDRPKLAEALAKAIRNAGRAPQLYIEVNIGKEAQKAGVLPEDLPVFLQFCRTSCMLSISGLMCIPPQGEDTAPYFTRMKKLADECGLKTISMGMSADYELAIRHGATEVRVGTAIFGARVNSPDQ